MQHPGGAQAEVAKATRVSMMSARRYPKVSPKNWVYSGLYSEFYICVYRLCIYIYIHSRYVYSDDTLQWFVYNQCHYHLLEAARSKVALFHLMADGISYLRLVPFTAHCLHVAFATCPGIRSQNRNEFVWLNSAIPNPTTKKTCFLTAITSTSPTCLFVFCCGKYTEAHCGRFGVFGQFSPSLLGGRNWCIQILEYIVISKFLWYTQQRANHHAKPLVDQPPR